MPSPTIGPRRWPSTTRFGTHAKMSTSRFVYRDPAMGVVTCALTSSFFPIGTRATRDQLRDVLSMALSRQAPSTVAAAARLAAGAPGSATATGAATAGATTQQAMMGPAPGSAGAGEFDGGDSSTAASGNYVDGTGARTAATGAALPGATGAAAKKASKAITKKAAAKAAAAATASPYGAPPANRASLYAGGDAAFAGTPTVPALPVAKPPKGKKTTMKATAAAPTNDPYDTPRPYGGMNPLGPPTTAAVSNPVPHGAVGYSSSGGAPTAAAKKKATARDKTAKKAASAGAMPTGVPVAPSSAPATASSMGAGGGAVGAPSPTAAPPVPAPAPAQTVLRGATVTGRPLSSGRVGGGGATGGYGLARSGVPTYGAAMASANKVGASGAYGVSGRSRPLPPTPATTDGASGVGAGPAVGGTTQASGYGYGSTGGPPPAYGVPRRPVRPPGPTVPQQPPSIAPGMIMGGRPGGDNYMG